MSKAKFAITVYADTLSGATSIAEEQISEFLGVDSDNISDSLDMEFLVTTPEESEDKPAKAKFEVMVYASLKRNAAVNFGTPR
jgi:hypothetical protein